MALQLSIIRRPRVRLKKMTLAPSRSALFIGAFAPSSQATRGISEDLSIRLASSGWQVRMTSRHASRLGRLADMLCTCWRWRNGYQVAAVDVFSGPAFMWAYAACSVLRKIGRPYLLMLHGGNLPSFAARRPRLVRTLLASAVAVTTPSRYLFERMQPYRKDLLLMPNAINVNTYDFALRRRVAPRLVWLRAFHNIYNPEMAIQVLALLTRDFPNIHLTMIGPDKRDGSMHRTRALAERMGVINHLTLSGGLPKEEVPKSLAVADIFLNTSQIDNTPVSVLEAMACGLCIVSTNVGGIPYLVRADQEALLVASNDVEGMAKAIRRVLTEPVLSQRLSYNARKKAEQFDWSIILPAWERLLSSLAQTVSKEETN